MILSVFFSLLDNRLFNFSLPFPLPILLSLLSFYSFVWLIWVCMISHSNNLFLQWWQGRCHGGWKTPSSFLLSPVWSDRLGEEHKSGRDGNGRHRSCQNPPLLTFLPGFLKMTGSSTLLFKPFNGREWDWETVAWKGGQRKKIVVGLMWWFGFAKASPRVSFFSHDLNWLWFGRRCHLIQNDLF